MEGIRGTINLESQKDIQVELSRSSLKLWGWCLGEKPTRGVYLGVILPILVAVP